VIPQIGTRWTLPEPQPHHSPRTNDATTPAAPQDGVCISASSKHTEQPAVAPDNSTSALHAAYAACPGPVPTGIRLLIGGPPGAGKSTHGIKLAQHFNVPHISMGSLLRDEVKRETSIGVDIAPLLKTGQLVKPEIAAHVLFQRLQQPDAQNGFVLDGFPRRMEDVTAMKIYEEKAQSGPIPMLHIHITEEEVLKRVEHRRICENGHPFDVSKTPDLKCCPEDHTPLKRREDDKPETVHERFEIYDDETLPVVNHYEARGLLQRVDGHGSVDTVFARVLAKAQVTVQASR
jgi:adenylate kinase